MKIKIAKKLTVILLLVSIIPLTVAVFLAYRQSAEAIREMILERLETLAEERANWLERMIAERRSDVASLAQMPSVRDALVNFTRTFSAGGLNSAAFQSIKSRHGPFLTSLTDRGKTDDLFRVGII